MAKSQIQKIYVGDSPIHGQGVFAAVDIKKGEVIERCPYLVIDDDDLAEENRLNDYLFTSPDVATDYLVIMGYGMMYNHSSDANAEWEIDDDNPLSNFLQPKTSKKGMRFSGLWRRILEDPRIIPINKSDELV